MRNENLKFKIFKNFIVFLDGEEKIAKVNSQIYSQGKGEDSPGSFGFKRTRKTNTGIVSKIACEKRSLG